MTPDAPLTAAWAAALYFLERALIGGRPGPGGERVCVWDSDCYPNTRSPCSGCRCSFSCCSIRAPATGFAAGSRMARQCWRWRYSPRSSSGIIRTIGLPSYFKPPAGWRISRSSRCTSSLPARGAADADRTGLGGPAAGAARGGRRTAGAMAFHADGRSECRSVYSPFSACVTKSSWIGPARRGWLPCPRSPTESCIPHRPFKRDSRLDPRRLGADPGRSRAALRGRTLLPRLGIPGVGYSKHSELIPVGWQEFGARIRQLADESERASGTVDRRHGSLCDRERTGVLRPRSRQVGARDHECASFRASGSDVRAVVSGHRQEGRTLLLVAWDRGDLASERVAVERRAAGTDRRGRLDARRPGHPALLLPLRPRLSGVRETSASCAVHGSESRRQLLMLNCGFGAYRRRPRRPRDSGRRRRKSPRRASSI